MTRFVPFAAIGISSLCLGAVAFAQPKTPVDLTVDREFTERFVSADKDRDGGLNAEEAGQAKFQFKEEFNVIDNDGNGVVTLFEIGKAMQRYLTGWSAADLDGDGVIDEEEYQKAKPTIGDVFSRADRDRDGRLTRDEYETFSHRQLYENVDMPYVVPNIIEKRF